MRQINFGGISASLNDRNVWTSRDKITQKRLNLFTDELKEDMSPAYGTPRDYIFARTIEEFKPDLTLNDEQPNEEPDGVIY